MSQVDVTNSGNVAKYIEVACRSVDVGEDEALASCSRKFGEGDDAAQSKRTRCGKHGRKVPT